MTLKKYYDALLAFDWDFGYRTDAVQRALHRTRYVELQRLSTTSLKHKKMFEDFIAYNTILIRNPRRKPKRPS